MRLTRPHNGALALSFLLVSIPGWSQEILLLPKSTEPQYANSSRSRVPPSAALSLEWRLPASITKYPKVLSPAVFPGTTTQFKDERPDRGRIGALVSSANWNEAIGLSVTTETDVAQWCRRHVGELLNMPDSAEQGGLLLEGVVQQFFVTEDFYFRGAVVIEYRLIDPSGQSRWRGAIQGKSFVTGETDPRLHYCEAFTEALVNSVFQLLQEQGFINAYREITGSYIQTDFAYIPREVAQFRTAQKNGMGGNRERRVHFGPRLGGGGGWMIGTMQEVVAKAVGNQPTPKFTVNAGLAWEIAIVKALSVQTELMFSAKGYRVELPLPPTGGAPGVDVGPFVMRARRNYLEVPVLVKLSPGTAFSYRPVFFAGAAVAFNVSATNKFTLTASQEYFDWNSTPPQTKTKDLSESEEVDMRTDSLFHDLYRTVDIPIVFGAGFDFRLRRGTVNWYIRASLGTLSFARYSDRMKEKLSTRYVQYPQDTERYNAVTMVLGLTY